MELPREATHEDQIGRVRLTREVNRREQRSRAQSDSYANGLTSLRRTNFINDGLGGGARILRCQDRPAHNDKVRPGFDGFRWSCSPRLVIAFGLRAVFILGPDTRRHN